MEEPKKLDSGNFGGKTIGTVGGGLYVFMTSVFPEGHPLKPLAMYAAPVVAVFCKEWGGALLFQFRLYVLSELRIYRLKKHKTKYIDRIPDGPEFRAVKEDATKNYAEAYSEVLKDDLKGVHRLGQLLGEKEGKPAPSDRDEK
ncbi:hypothetical protein [uncultured Pseudomonas sp.]|uniref:hypothetical protein n=1 Tax=uncultured Pseudomonas sp. TaxID=114707 RepID=UPI002588D291|nr:hypothetical protein [uncultured Pseudomonas sp.]